MMYEIDGFVFDLDGTVYLGEHALPGAVEAIAELRRKGKKTLFVSNKPVEPGRNYATKLTRLGIPTTSGDVITSALVLGHHLSKTAPLLKLYVVGEQSLRQELREHGLDVLDELPGQDPQGVIDPSGIDAVVIAFDRTIDYRKLNTAYQALRAGARFFATNADPVCPMPGGAIPDAGATIRALESITGRDLELLAGKPSPLMMQVAMQRMELPPERCMLIGDRLETDLRMGQEAGFVTAVVLTGVTKRSDLACLTRPPDIVLENLGELLAWVS